MEVSGQLHAPVTLPPPKELQYPLDKRFSRPKNQSGCCVEDKNLALPGTVKLLLNCIRKTKVSPHLDFTLSSNQTYIF
jgi:hypothetical protein